MRSASSAKLHRRRALVYVLQCGTYGHAGGPDDPTDLGPIADIALERLDDIIAPLDVA